MPFVSGVLARPLHIVEVNREDIMDTYSNEITDGHHNGRLMAILAYAYGGAEQLWELACDAGFQ